MSSYVEGTRFMQLADAIEVVLQLARQAAHSEKKEVACDVLEDFAVNHLGDD